MAIIDPDGLFEGERLAACSDIAQLYWQRLFLAANSCARMELSYPTILGKVFKTFKSPPSQGELWAIFEELERNFLAILYESEGTWWCQFVTSEKHLPQYKKARDKASPAPPPEMVEKHAAGYKDWKKGNSLKNQSFRKSSENFQRRGIGEVVGEVKEEAEERRGKRNDAPQETPPPDSADTINRIVCAHPKSKARNLQPREVRQRDQAAVLQAMMDEIQASGTSAAECLAMMLERVQMLADKVPRSEWRFFKDVSEFFLSHDYRLEPEDFTRGKANGKTEQRRGGNVERTANNRATVRAAFADEGGQEPTADTDRADDGRVSASGVGRGHDENLAPGVRGAGPPARDRESPRSPPVVLDATKVVSLSQRSERGS